MKMKQLELRVGGVCWRVPSIRTPNDTLLAGKLRREPARLKAKSKKKATGEKRSRKVEIARRTELGKACH